MFDDEPSIGGEEGIQQAVESLYIGHRIGWIGEDDIELRRGLIGFKSGQSVFGEGLYGGEGVAGGDVPLGQVPIFGDVFLVGDVFFVEVDAKHALRIARKKFQGDDAGAGEQVEHEGIGDAFLVVEGIEKGFSHAVCGGTHVVGKIGGNDAAF